MRRLIFDVETRSEVDLSEVGAWNYSRHPSTRVMCVALTNEDHNVRCYDTRFGQHPKEWDIAVREGWDIFAWNTFFEYCITTNVLKHWPQPKFSQWKDAQFTALTAARPAKLGEAALALGLSEQKDKGGKPLINFFCSPITNGSHKGQFREPSDHPERFQAMMDYCAQDVRTTKAILDRLPDPSESEWTHYQNTLALNIKGVQIDRRLVQNLITMADVGRAKVGESLIGTGLTADDMDNHRKILLYANSNGANLVSVDKPSVKEALDTDLPESVRLVLSARQALGQTAVAKLPHLLNQTDENGYLHDYLRASGTQTGRDGGMGVQPQNLPRGVKGLDVESLIDAALRSDAESFMSLAKDNPLGAIASCLRGCFTAGPSEQLFQCDWSAIEPRLGAWVVGDTDMLEAFRSIDAEGGVDIYQIEAARFYGCEPAEIKGERRQFGKVFVLQNQYGSGENSIQTAAHDMYGLNLSIEEALQCKEVWRSLHPKWVEMWYSLRDGAVAATKHPGVVIRCGKVAWCHNKGDLRLRLPCGRFVTLPDARMEMRDGKYGRREELVYSACVHGKMVAETLAPGQAFNFVVQGMGASLLRWASSNLIKSGFSPVLRLHDEMVVSVPLDKSFDEFKQIFLTPPPWAPDLPINGAGWIGPRFKKD